MKHEKPYSYPLLSSIHSPEDIKNIKNIESLCLEVRHKIIEVVSKNGGHLSSNLGIVELTAAIYKVFDVSRDKIIWDVGHQCYAHKMFTNRFKSIGKLRKENGLSGFTNRKESPFDIFTSGHSSTSISAALGIASSKKLLEEEGNIIAVIGDGALTGGLAYEGLNNAQKLKNFILILNDNSMSISKNVGAVARYLAAARIKPSYMKAKHILEGILEKTQIGLKIENFMNQSKSAFKNLIYKSSIFEDMGFVYYGPIDGHNINQLQSTLSTIKDIKQPKVVHVVTKKGKGYKFAEKSPHIFHGVSPFNIRTGEIKKKSDLTFSKVFGETLCKIAAKNPKLCAVTAAMASGTGLNLFRSQFKSRFFDVGIAEGHAVTFCSGLSAGGLIPVFAVYSSFLQRSYDQLIHDCSMQELKIILGIDRAGFVGEDGEAHQGLFDVSFLNTIPNVKVFAPTFFDELQDAMEKAVDDSRSNIVAIRYPKGEEPEKPEWFKSLGKDFEFYGQKDARILIVTYGRIFAQACICQRELKNLGIDICILKLNVVKPISNEAVMMSLGFQNILFFEESIKSGGAGEKFASMILELGGFKGKYFIYAVNDMFVSQATVCSQLSRFSLDFLGMKNRILDLLK